MSDIYSQLLYETCSRSVPDFPSAMALPYICTRYVQPGPTCLVPGLVVFEILEQPVE